MKRNKTLSSKDFQQEELWCEMTESPCCKATVFWDSRFCSHCGKKLYTKKENTFHWVRKEASYSRENEQLIEGYKEDEWGFYRKVYHRDHKIVRDYNNGEVRIYSTVYDSAWRLYDCVKAYSYTETYSDGGNRLIRSERLKEYPKLLAELNKN